MNGASLYRYPVKGLSPEKLSSVQLTEGMGFPLDRRYALLRAEAAFDPRTLNAAWTAPQDLPESYRCTDCGTGRDAVTS